MMLASFLVGAVVAEGLAGLYSAALLVIILRKPESSLISRVPNQRLTALLFNRPKNDDMTDTETSRQQPQSPYPVLPNLCIRYQENGPARLTLALESSSCS